MQISAQNLRPISPELEGPTRVPSANFYHYNVSCEPASYKLTFPASVLDRLGTVQDIRRYAGTTVDWVIKVPHLICAPSRTGQIYTHTTGAVRDWYHRERGPKWREVVRGDALQPGVYEFEASTLIALQPLFVDEYKYATVDAWVTLSPTALVVSHLIPKRMGTSGAKAAVADFVGAQEALVVH
ncbi:unnamed protein product [Cyclocybe aegerita]|uniref:Uncharacterized protein n=1 Tax=Cyclocybe aegerita TaxID=1973307 RepID=A0A8S0W6G2_CYCAE|nr:unnamed protein product [Cyclocybe aegerita]